MNQVDIQINNRQINIDGHIDKQMTDVERERKNFELKNIQRNLSNKMEFSQIDN